LTAHFGIDGRVQSFIFYCMTVFLLFFGELEGVKISV